MDSSDPPRVDLSRERLNTAAIEIAIRLAALALVLYWTILLLRPFLTILLWSVVLAVALYPLFNRAAVALGERRTLAAALITAAGLFVVIGPAAWLGLGVMDPFRYLSDQLGSGAFGVPPPSEAVKTWPVIGGQLFRLWDLASNNLKQALDEIIPYLKPYGSSLLGAATGAGAGLLNFFVSVIVAG